MMRQVLQQLFSRIVVKDKVVLNLAIQDKTGNPKQSGSKIEWCKKGKGME